MSFNEVLSIDEKEDLIAKQKDIQQTLERFETASKAAELLAREVIEKRMVILEIIKEKAKQIVAVEEPDTANLEVYKGGLNYLEATIGKIFNPEDFWEHWVTLNMAIKAILPTTEASELKGILKNFERLDIKERLKPTKKLSFVNPEYIKDHHQYAQEEAKKKS